MPDLEAIGDAVTGGVIGRAVEPKAGEAAGHTNEKNCLNCGAELAGDYCHECGQRAHVHRTLSAFWHDLLHGVLHFEGKIWRTLPLLAWKPGELTRRYIEGERAKFVSPIALFLFSVFLMFAVINLLGSPDFSGQETMSPAERREMIQDKLQDMQVERAEMARSGRTTAIHDRVIKELQTELAGGARARETDAGIIDIQTDSDLGWFDAAYRKAKQNPDLLFYKIQSNAYKFSWLLIPLSVPFVWLLFLHRRRYREYRAYDHTVFVTYSLSFVTLLVVAFTVIGRVVGSNDVAVLGITLVPPLHMYRQLKAAYGLSRWSALWRTALLLLFALICIGIFLLMLVMMGVM